MIRSRCSCAGCEIVLAAELGDIHCPFTVSGAATARRSYSISLADCRSPFHLIGGRLIFHPGGLDHVVSSRCLVGIEDFAPHVAALARWNTSARSAGASDQTTRTETPGAPIQHGAPARPHPNEPRPPAPHTRAAPPEARQVSYLGILSIVGCFSAGQRLAPRSGRRAGSENRPPGTISAIWAPQKTNYRV